MLELITISLLSIAYVNACIEEAKEEERLKEEERIRDLKIEVFCYAVGHKLLYEDVVRKIENKELTLEEIHNEQ